MSTLTKVVFNVWNKSAVDWFDLNIYVIKKKVGSSHYGKRSGTHLSEQSQNILEEIKRIRVIPL